MSAYLENQEHHPPQILNPGETIYRSDLVAEHSLGEIFHSSIGRLDIMTLRFVV